MMKELKFPLVRLRYRNGNGEIITWVCALW